MHLSVRQVADQAELARLRAGLEPPTPPAPTIQTLEAVQSDVVKRLTTAMKQVWPDQLPPLKSFELALSPDGIAVHIEYESLRPIPTVAEEVLSRSLETQLGVKPIRLITKNIKPPRAARKSRKVQKAR